MKPKLFIKDDKGGAVVEFAIVLPLLLLFLFGIIEFGLLFYNKAMITNASREGARNGIVYDVGPGADGTLGTGDDTYHPDAAQIKQKVRDYAEDVLITFGSDVLDTTNIGVCVNATGACNPPAAEDTRFAPAGDTLTVTATYNYDFLVFPNLAELVYGTFTNTITLRTETVMRFE